MRFLYFSDPHFRTTQPRYRLDNFFDVQINKLKNVIQIATQNKCDFIVCGGDFFDSPNPSHQLISAILETLSTNKIDFYSLIGNHDVYGHNLDTINRTGLGVLFASKLVKPSRLLEFDDNNYKIVLSMHDYTQELYDPEIHCLKLTQDYRIVISHCMITDVDTVFEHSLIENIKTDANLFLCSHYHVPFKCESKNIRGEKNLFLNPGCFTRQNKNEFKQSVNVVLCDISKKASNIRTIKLNNDSEDSKIFDYKSIELEEKLKPFL